MRRFEASFASFTGARYGVAVSSGTTALEIALRAMGVDSAAEVIVPAYTFFSTASAVLRVNAIPVFADIDPVTYCMDLRSVESNLTNETQAVVPVHMFGYPMDVDPLLSLAARRGIKVLEDCAHAHGAGRNGRRAGSWGDMSIFSFMSSKLMPAGEGGIILASSRELAGRAASLRDCGRLPKKSPYEHYLAGSNHRLTEFQAVILSEQLERFPGLADTRRAFVAKLCQRIGEIEGLRIGQQKEESIEHAYLCMPIEYDCQAFHGVHLKLFCLALQKEGIPCETGYERPVYKNPLFQERNFDRHQCPVRCSFYGRTVDFENVDCPVAEELCQRLILLPHYMLSGDEEDIDDIAAAFLKVKENAMDLLFETDLEKLIDES